MLRDRSDRAISFELLRTGVEEREISEVSFLTQIPRRRGDVVMSSA